MKLWDKTTRLVLFYLTLHIQGTNPVGLEGQELLWQRHFAVPSSGGGGAALDLLPPPGSALSEQEKEKKTPQDWIYPHNALGKNLYHSSSEEKKKNKRGWNKGWRKNFPTAAAAAGPGLLSPEWVSHPSGWEIKGSQKQPQPHPCQL